MKTETAAKQETEDQRIFVGKSEIRPIHLNVDARRDVAAEIGSFIPGGVYEADRFPGLERAAREWQARAERLAPK